MIDLLEESQRLLNEVGSATALVKTSQGTALAFEDATVLGFILTYNDPAQLLARWSADATALISENQIGLRRAQYKAWNTYTVFISSAVATYGEMVALSNVEENLTGTRKIARAGIRDGAELRAALLPLLPIQNAPRLEAIDMMAEIKLRTTELPARAIQAFLSGAQESSVVQVLEEEP
ncbi:MAG TPA: hypothetical protein VLB76_25655 [Thermoanaerobaculia bacterium]|jgi:hypothetical protein|nr:hypothetical protein [Thermoanaerobaculia bacterium]